MSEQSTAYSSFSLHMKFFHSSCVTSIIPIDVIACSKFGYFYVDITAEEPSNGFNVICHGNGLTANGVSKHVASATVDAKLDIHKTPPPSKR